MNDECKNEIALEIKAAFNTVSPFIEKHTAIVCPACEEVCCTDKHSRYDKDDNVFIEVLYAEMPVKDSVRRESDPCRFLEEKGCSLQRWMRPFRCTFFFCAPLLKSLEKDNAKLYRAFVEYFQHLVALREKLLGL
jgi:hypothetical protein